MKLNSLEDLLHYELKDLYSAENQLVKALPKMATAATNADLRAGFEEHLEQTHGHVERLEAIAKKLGVKLTGHKVQGNGGPRGGRRRADRRRCGRLRPRRRPH